MDNLEPMPPPDRRLVAIAPLPASDNGRGPTLHPAPRSPLIGRDAEVALVSDLLLRDDVPLVTLTGPGGVGKTRIARQVAADAAPAFADGVCWVDLAAVRDPRFVLPTIAQAFGLSDKGPQPAAEQLVTHLRSQSLLLVLDNVEQVVEAAPRIAELFVACPQLTILATSRIVLRLSDEHDVPIAPLTVPASVQLFVTRARAAQPGFALTGENAASVAAICARLDGLPLAIELAAARVRVLSPEALLKRIDPVLPLLTGGARDLPDRLRTMHAAIAWSFDLLSPVDQVLFGRLAVFIGGFALRSAETVCDLLPAEIRVLTPAYTMLDVVQALVENSLLTQVEGIERDEPRYRMLETVREFGLERLTASGEETEVRSGHAIVMLSIAETVSRQLDSSDYELNLSRLDLEHDNVRFALAWAEASGSAELALRLSEAMARFWAIRGHYREGRNWIERALAIGEPVPTLPRLRALRAAGWLARLQGELDAAAAFQRESLETAQAMDDLENAAAALQELGLISMHRGAHEEAMRQIEQALALLELSKDDLPAGAHLLSVAHANLGQIALAHGDIVRAICHAEEAVRRQRALGYAWALGDTLRILGDVAQVRGDYPGALAAYRESVELIRNHGDRRFLINSLAGIADVAAAQGNADCAARLYGATAILREQLGLVVESWQRIRHEQGIAKTQASLSPDQFAGAWAAGERLALEEAVGEAIAATTLLTLSPRSPELSAPGFDAGLTPRETDVLRLLAEGLQDRQIAEALFISPRTASFHVANLLAKLGVESRAAAAAFAVRHGLD